MSDKSYTCKAYGRENKMVDKFCGNCGVENIHKLGAIYGRLLAQKEGQYTPEEQKQDYISLFTNQL